MIVPVILAGGSGTRLWPLSRQLYPKQLLSLTDEQTMLQQTLMRVIDVEEVTEPLVICNETYRYIISEQLRQSGVRPESLILEPVGRNTAPAVAVAALRAEKLDPEAMILVLPADHLIQDIAIFHQALHTAARYAAKGDLVTFGVIPTSPETGYGYIRIGRPVHAGDQETNPGETYAIREFVEKPDLETARRYLDSGEYCWNSGMFLFRAVDILEELGRFSPDILAACRDACKAGITDGDAFLLDPEAFARCRSDSVDYAVMEKTDRGVMVPFDAGWDDVGSWEALWGLGKKDDHGNVIRGDVMGHGNLNSLIYAESRLVAVLGLTDVIVVESPDTVLVASRKRCQEVKSVVADLLKENRKEALGHSKTYYPWGTVEDLKVDDQMVVRRVTVDNGSDFRVTPPPGRVLNWVVIAGGGDVRIDDKKIAVEKNTTLRIDPGKPVNIILSDGDPIVFTEVFAPGDGGPDHFNNGRS